MNRTEPPGALIPAPPCTGGTGPPAATARPGARSKNPTVVTRAIQRIANLLERDLLSPPIRLERRNRSHSCCDTRFVGLLDRLRVLRDPAYQQWRADRQRFGRILSIGTKVGPVTELRLEIHA